MGTWQTRTCVETDPERVLELLTDPSAAERWAPVPFEVDGLEQPRLSPGARLRLGGRIAGRSVGFDVHIRDVDAERLELEASGPFEIAAQYEARPGCCGGTELHASVSVSGGGIKGRLLSAAAEAFLAGGALESTLARIASEAELVAA